MYRHEYYAKYYNCKKHIYREKYYEKKKAEIEREQLFRPYGGEQNYYKNKLIEMGFIFVKN